MHNKKSRGKTNVTSQHCLALGRRKKTGKIVLPRCNCGCLCLNLVSSSNYFKSCSQCVRTFVSSPPPWSNEFVYSMLSLTMVTNARHRARLKYMLNLLVAFLSSVPHIYWKKYSNLRLYVMFGVKTTIG